MKILAVFLLTACAQPFPVAKDVRFNDNTHGLYIYQDGKLIGAVLNDK